MLDKSAEWDEFRDLKQEAAGRRALLAAMENHKDDKSKDPVEKLWKKASSALEQVLP